MKRRREHERRPTHNPSRQQLPSNHATEPASTTGAESELAAQYLGTIRSTRALVLDEALSSAYAMAADIFEVYVALWQRAKGLGARVLYIGIMPHAGCFHPDPQERGRDDPEILISRRGYKEIGRPSRELSDGNEADLLGETITLAHEFGHFMSWKARTPRGDWNRYMDVLGVRDDAWAAVPGGGTVDEYNDALRAAAQRALTREQMDLIVAEEERAWAIGREALEELGFAEFEIYDQRTCSGVHAHRYRLGLDELWPEDRRNDDGRHRRDHLEFG